MIKNLLIKECGTQCACKYSSHFVWDEYSQVKHVPSSLISKFFNYPHFYETTLHLSGTITIVTLVLDILPYVARVRLFAVKNPRTKVANVANILLFIALHSNDRRNIGALLKSIIIGSGLVRFIEQSSSKSNSTHAPNPIYNDRYLPLPHC